jgi:aminomethyltransferase
MALLRTPLYDSHVELGAKMVDFAGWDMPVQYEGVIVESLSVRESAGMFDVSHMGRVWFEGPSAFEFLERLTTNDVSKLEDYGSQYSLICTEVGTCIDDIIVYRISSELFRIVMNASNRQRDLEWARLYNDGGVDIRDETMETAMIAIQGPLAVSKLQSLSVQSLSDVKRFHAIICDVAGVPAFAARTGYTGEDGFELIISARDAKTVWTALYDAGVVPCGLASRDVLRVEAGLPLYGNELNDRVNPIEVGLGWVCSKSKPYLGSASIEKMRTEGSITKLVGIRMEEKLIPRRGCRVFRGDRSIGMMSSGVYSPLFGCGIGFAFVGTVDVEMDSDCTVMIRDKAHPAKMVNKRFLSKKLD